MSSRSAQRGRSTPRLTKRQTSACLECVVLLSEASNCFGDETKPLWLRTTEGMQVLDGVPFADLPKKLQQQIQQSKAAINGILQHYNLNTSRDYQILTEADLLRIQNLLLNTVYSLEQILLPHR